LIEKLVRHKNQEITTAGEMREKSPGDYSLTVAWSKQHRILSVNGPNLTMVVGEYVTMGKFIR